MKALTEVVAAAAVAAGITTMLGGIYLARVEAAPGVTIEQPCYEDERCWDPATMGNGLGSLPAGETPVPGDHSPANP
ncbi:hypothetical protein SEA_NEOS5_63 [Mycobacterium phage Neos5]|uniref:Uncharacterized protein n=6 Tax=Pipefishvirus TaxID=1982899 RepID=X2KN07_9CAUD|nr:hypothetical protein PHAEDRUS_59 [Mycobacterium phage Phaedrus]YP_002564162.1 gp64 [Mycobacterium phage Phlyer]YP_009011296.1 hypothetical protein CM02_gp065 [Mycobacterium phage Gadjet]YP_009018574.1 hypothetical protein CM10_gp064 [Mycobacterium phage Akoma]YP_009604452.1 hypothetical protein FDH90_gp066 [Mycobacterium phage Athena]YP_010103854.1 hypothetical protein KNU70_gp065 [Mycobacterium phage Obutu]AEJ94773.1 hypothetical protein DAISY_63 [Mycobacterium phage Daisy]AER50195.1 hyp